MVFLNYSTMQMVAKIVYYGPGLCGKTTNLKEIYRKTSSKSRGEMVSLETETDRTLFFDLLPMDVGVIGGFKTKFQLYTVPGQVFYNSTRKLVLRGVDGIVFVADSQRPMIEANQDSYENLLENLDEMGLNIEDIPVVFQYNKRDLPNILTISELNDALNDLNRPIVEASALQGIGVFETLKEISKQTLLKLRNRAVSSDKKKEAAAPARGPVKPQKREPKAEVPATIAPPVAPAPEPEPALVNFDSLPGTSRESEKHSQPSFELETGLPTVIESRAEVMQPGPDGRLKDRRDSTLDNFDLDFPDEELTDDSLDLDELGGLDEGDQLSDAAFNTQKEEDADPFGFGKDDDEDEDFGLESLTNAPAPTPAVEAFNPLTLDPDDPFMDEELLERLTAPDPPPAPVAPVIAKAIPVQAPEVAKAAPKLEPKIAAKPDVKPEPKVEVKAEAKPEPKVEAKPEPKVEARPELKVEAKPEPKVEAKPEPRVEAKPEPKVEAKPEPKVEAKTEVKVEPKPEVRTEPKTVEKPRSPAVAKPAESVTKAVLKDAVEPIEQKLKHKKNIGDEPTVKQDLLESYPNPSKRLDLTSSLKELDELSHQVRSKPTKTLSQKHQLDAIISDLADLGSSKKAKLEKISFKVPDNFSNAQLNLVLLDDDDNVIHTHLAKVEAVELEPGHFQLKLQFDIEVES